MALGYIGYSTGNLESVKSSVFCYCVSCLEKFESSKVCLDEEELIQEPKTQQWTVSCPHCYVDAVVPVDESDHTLPPNAVIRVTQELLKEWHNEGFGSSEPSNYTDEQIEFLGKVFDEGPPELTPDLLKRFEEMGFGNSGAPMPPWWNQDDDDDFSDEENE